MTHWLIVFVVFVACSGDPIPGWHPLIITVKENGVITAPQPPKPDAACSWQIWARQPLSGEREFYNPDELPAPQLPVPQELRRR